MDAKGINLGLAVRLLWRDWRGGELTLLLASLVIAIGTVTTITLFIDRLQQALISESATFLAADRVISSAKPVPEEWLLEAKRLGLETGSSLSFLSMVFAADRAQLSSVKAVSNEYPLRGKLRVADRPFVAGEVVGAGPGPGEIWLESRLLPALGISVGDVLDVDGGRGDGASSNVRQNVEHELLEHLPLPGVQGLLQRQIRGPQGTRDAALAAHVTLLVNQRQQEFFVAERLRTSLFAHLLKTAANGRQP